MAMEFKLPDIGEGVAEGEIVRWMVEVGAHVEEDQPMVEVMTDKATVEIPSPRAGSILEIRAKDGETVPVGFVIVVIGGEDDSNGAPSSPASKSAAPESRHVPSASAGSGGSSGSHSSSSTAVVATPSTANGGRVLATPATRKLARKLGADITQIQGTGPRDRITRDDVRRFVEGAPAPGAKPSMAPVSSTQPVATKPAQPSYSPPPQAGTEQRIPLRGMRKRIAQAMRRSKDMAAHFTYVDEFDFTNLKDLREGAKEIGASRGVKITYMPFIMKAVVAALKRFPNLNASFDDDAQELVVKGYYNIGFATDTDAGLIVPVVKDVDRKSVFQVAQEMAELIDRARQGKSQIEDLQGGTFTITNAGSLGGLFATPIINYPEVAILGVHKLRRTPVVLEGDQIAIRDMMNLSISLDHRVIDGADGARFMNELMRFLEDPKLLILETV